MPTYTCEKCARVFKQKSGFDDHKAKKNDCSNNTIIAAVVAAKVEEKVKEAIRATHQKPDITKETLPAFFEDLHNLLWNKAGLNPERALEHMTFFFAYRLIEQQADTLSLPQECRWSYIASLKNENDLFETIKKGVSEFRKRPKTKAFFKPHEIQKADIVFEIVQQINRISLKILQETDTLGDIFEYMLGRGMSTMSDEGQYFTNRAICKLAFKLAYDIKKNLRRDDGTLCTFADWFCGTGGFPAEFVKGVKANIPVDWKKDSASVYCQDMNLSSVTTTLLNMLILTGIPFNSDKIRGSNSFTDAITTGASAPFNGLTIDYCFMNPPYGGDKNKGKEYKFAYSKKVKGEDGRTTKKFFVNQEIQSIGIEDDAKVSAGVQLAMATLADGGVCSIVLPQGFFTNSGQKCVELRKKIAEEYKVWFVVDIASGAFKNTPTKTSMMVFQKGVGPTDKVSFIGLDEKLLIEATLTELRAKNYIFNYKQYLQQSAVEVDGFEMVKLGDLVNFSGGKFTTGYSKINPGTYPFFSGKTLQPDGTCKDFCFDGEEYLVMIKDGGSGIGNYSDTVGMGKVFYVKGKSAGTSHNLALHRKSDMVILMYLYYYLKTIRPKIMDLAKYTTGLGVIGQAEIRDIDIAIPSLERQQQIVEAIDGWAGLAQQEEVALKILEKQMMFQIKEMGRGQAHVKLGEVCDINSGQSFRKEDIIPGDIPVIGGGKIVGYHNQSNRPGNEFSITRVGDCCLNWFYNPYMLTEHGFSITLKGDASNKYLLNTIYYHFNSVKDDLILQYDGTAQKLVTKTKLRDFDIPSFKLDEVTQLQSDFDEIRHKHAKIARYKAKAQEAIQRLIPAAT
jgi:type I restriction-modification system DNA methylase subunit/restriction endonuclease S subunit